MPKTSKKKLSAFEQYQKAKEQQQKTYRSILSDALKENEDFQNFDKARKVVNRLTRECESYLSDEGKEKHRARIEARIEALNEQLEEIDTKSEKAESALPGLREVSDSYDDALNRVGASLVKHLDGGEIPTTDEGLQAIVEDVMSEVDLTTLDVTDPFAEYRAANRKSAATDDEDESSDED